MSKLEMRAVEVTLLRPVGGSPSDPRLVPADGASVAVALEGATVTADATCYDWTVTNVAVAGSGRIQAGDNLQAGADDTKKLTVATISSDGRTLGLSAWNGTEVDLVAGDRLIPISGVPLLFADSLGALPIGNVVTTDSTGYARFYSPESRVDMLASGGGLPDPLAFQDIIAGWLAGGSPILNAKEYPSIQAAVDALPSTGGTVLVPNGTYTPSTTPAFSGLTIRTGNVVLAGEPGTILELSSSTYKDTDLILLQAGGVTLRQISLIGPGVQGNGCGIRCIGRNSSGASIEIAGLVFEQLVIRSTAFWGIQLLTDVGYSQWNHTFDRVTCYEASSGGSVNIGPRTTGPVQISMRDCQFNGPNFDTYGSSGDSALTKGAVHLENCVNVVIDNCTFQPSNLGTVLSIDGGHNNNISNCHLEPYTSNEASPPQYWITASGANQVNEGTVIENLSVYRKSTNALRFLCTDPVGAITSWAIRDCGLFHTEGVISSPPDDVALNASADVALISNVEVTHYVTGAHRVLRVTNRPGVTLLASGLDTWQLRIPGVSSPAVVLNPPLEGTLIWDLGIHKLRVFEPGGWQTLSLSAAIVDGSGNVITHDGDIVLG